jgi:hypothetical protein
VDARETSATGGIEDEPVAAGPATSDRLRRTLGRWR